ncbi:DEAD H (Asp-Glu-Ala-Asp His) box helicase 11, partial [Quaeritorhiza haematococci]
MSTAVSTPTSTAADEATGPVSDLPSSETERDFSFPFTPWPIQLEFMHKLYEALETEKGKSLSLICGTLTWLRDHQRRTAEGSPTEAVTVSEELQDGDDDGMARRTHVQREKKDSLFMILDPPDPPWVREAILKQKADRIRGETQKKLEKKKEWITRINETRKRSLNGALPPAKRVKTAHEQPHIRKTTNDEDKYVVADYIDSPDSSKKPSPYELLKEPDEEIEFDDVKVLYCSRTHSQLSQFVAELRKTPFIDNIRVVALGSRKNLCINENVLKLKSLPRITDRCLELQKAKNGSCPHLTNDREMLEDFTLNVQLITLPYNLVLQKSAREALGIDVKNNVVIFDEAHNLVDAISSMYSVSVDAQQIDRAQAQLTLYFTTYRNRLKGKNIVYIKQLLHLLKSLKNFFTNMSSQSKSRGTSQQVKKPNDFLHELNIDNINIIELQKYLVVSRLAQKLHGFIDTQKENTAPNDKNAKNNSNGQPEQHEPRNLSTLQQIQDFFMSLTNDDVDGRVIVSLDEFPEKHSMKYLLLNPSDAFREIVTQARAVVLAGGTMEPHVIPRGNLQTLILKTGPSGREMNFSFDKRSNPQLMDEVAIAVSNLCKLIPGGVVCFFPSFSYLDTIYDRWKKTQALDRIKKTKDVFLEPRQGTAVEETLTKYGNAIAKNRQGGPEASSKNGALILCVVGGKLSEGINFSDDLGRGVLMIGLPFANITSPDLKEKMKHAESKGGGDEFYENLCMRAVNQSIGRAIRHKNDYATIALLDGRFIRPRIKGKLPKWIRDSDVYECERFGEAVQHVAK